MQALASPLLARTMGLLAVLLCCAPSAAGEPKAPMEGERLRLYDLALDDWIEQTARLQRISQSIRLVGAEACGKKLSPILGITVLSPGEVRSELQKVAKQRFGEQDGVHVVAVFEGMAAATAGLLPGDRLVEVEGRPVRKEKDVYQPRHAEGRALMLRFERDGALQSASLDAPRGCVYRARLYAKSEINAFADGKITKFATGMLQTMKDDSSLALVVGHEVAHNFMRDVQRGRWNQSVQNEARADYLGAYLAAMAGYYAPLDEEYFGVMIEYQGQMSTENTTHPSTPMRTGALRKTLAEIDEKRRANQPLDLK
jgi:hypothetical protein